MSVCTDLDACHIGHRQPQRFQGFLLNSYSRSKYPVQLQYPWRNQDSY